MRGGGASSCVPRVVTTVAAVTADAISAAVMAVSMAPSPADCDNAESPDAPSGSTDAVSVSSVKDIERAPPGGDDGASVRGGAAMVTAEKRRNDGRRNVLSSCGDRGGDGDRGGTAIVVGVAGPEEAATDTAGGDAGVREAGDAPPRSPSTATFGTSLMLPVEASALRKASLSGSAPGRGFSPSAATPVATVVR